MKSVIDFIFSGTVLVLEKVASVAGCTYKQINVVIWYVGLPVVIAVLIDLLLHTFIFTAGAITIITAITILATLTKQLRRLIDFIFEKSVESLESMNGLFGIDYKTASVWVCLIIPVVVVAGVIVVLLIL